MDGDKTTESCHGRAGSERVHALQAQDWKAGWLAGSGWLSVCPVCKLVKRPEFPPGLIAPSWPYPGTGPRSLPTYLPSPRSIPSTPCFPTGYLSFTAFSVRLPRHQKIPGNRAIHCTYAKYLYSKCT